MLFAGLLSSKRPSRLQITTSDLGEARKSACHCVLLSRTLAAVLLPLLNSSWGNMMQACTFVSCTMWACTEGPENGCVSCVDVPNGNVASNTVLGLTRHVRA